MECAFLNKKGQASIEFILLIILMLLYVQTIILPAIDMSKSSVKGTMGLGEAVFAGEKIANAINYVGSGSGNGKETISVYVPTGAEISCGTKQIIVKYTLPFAAGDVSTSKGKCVNVIGGPGSTCTKNIPTFVTFDCLGGLPYSGDDKGVTFTVAKDDTGTHVKAA